MKRTMHGGSWIVRGCMSCAARSIGSAKRSGRVYIVVENRTKWSLINRDAIEDEVALGNQK